jgi:hypothetical protein
MAGAKKIDTTYSIKASKGKQKPKALYCELCGGKTHTKVDCIFDEELDFEEAEDDTEADLDAEFLNEPEVDSSTVVAYGTEKHTITGVIRVMRETGNEEGAELLQQMDEVAKTTRKLYKATKKKTGRFSAEDVEDLEKTK